MLAGLVLVLALGLGGACGGGDEEARRPTTTTTTTTTTVASAATTTNLEANASPRSEALQWTAAATSHLEEVEDGFSELTGADPESYKAVAIRLDDKLRDLRTVLTAKGPPPPYVADEGRAFIEAVKEAEASATALASCEGDCLAPVSDFDVAVESYYSASAALFDKVNGTGP